MEGPIVEKIQEAIDLIGAAENDPQTLWQRSTDVARAKKSLGSEPPPGQGGRASGAIRADRKTQNAVLSKRPVLGAIRRIEAAILTRSDALLAMQGRRIKRGRLSS